MASGIISPYGAQPTRPAPRRFVRDLEAISHHSQTETYKVAGLHQVTRLAMFETMQTGMARRTAELAVPDQADLLQAINMAAGWATVKIISGMHRG